MPGEEWIRDGQCHLGGASDAEEAGKHDANADAGEAEEDPLGDDHAEDEVVELRDAGIARGLAKEPDVASDEPGLRTTMRNGNGDPPVLSELY